MSCDLVAEAFFASPDRAPEFRVCSQEWMRMFEIVKRKFIRFVRLPSPATNDSVTALSVPGEFGKLSLREKSRGRSFYDACLFAETAGIDHESDQVS